MLTSGTLSALQELLASWLAHDRSKNGHYFSSRIPKMAIYGAFISAPMGHALIGVLQWIFAGRTSLKAKVLQIITSNLVVSSIASLDGDAANQRTSDRADPKLGLSDIHGSHCWCSHVAPGSCHCQGWFLACHESQLDYLSNCSGLCPEIPP